ncbi:3-deoxy-D-manno-octulosonic acid transferase [Paracoccus kondratievae]|uniref:3-deoxy-D-manno-octulosonic acid transferase n=1 Tax=Paracoccus kondratievae TaxID=135740 RepID=A0AAD3P1H1_9RHOB|nr:3-deoxy-D-manno-octulosonic acid transferase [Paracoccus kondratievae]SMG52413.1 3-deoxy-D-manno-octulosonic-acid transferase [Paracoccus sp. J56]
MPPSDAPASLALWLHLRRRAVLSGGPGAPVAIPAGTGPLLIVHLSAQGDEASRLTALIEALQSRRPELRVVLTGARLPLDPLPGGIATATLPLPQDPSAAREVVRTLQPRALLILGDDLPAALITAMAEQHLPAILCEARLVTYNRRHSWRGAVIRGLIGRISHILAPDPTAAAAARQLGAAPERIELTGPITETRPPLSANEAERRALAQILAGRHVWLAACPTLPEATAALAAHQAALHHNHRALLIIAGLPPELVPEIHVAAGALGLAAVLRTDDDDPSPDDHVLIADDPYEMGLWYRLAPVSFLGGTLLPGPGLSPRHPFEPAALGSAIIHGPITGAHAPEWVQLDGASAARLVTDTAGLTRAVADLSAPDQAAVLAGNAWSVSTGGAAALHRIAETVLTAMEPTK